jgi:hypothetical protein
VAFVLVELGARVAVGEAVEVGEEVGLCVGRVFAPDQVVDQSLGVDLLLNIEGRSLDDEVGPVLLVLAAPDELRVEVAVAALVGEPQGGLLGLCITDWNSAVGMFLREASSWVRVSTIFFGGSLGDLTGMVLA